MLRERFFKNKGMKIQIESKIKRMNIFKKDSYEHF